MQVRSKSWWWQQRRLNQEVGVCHRWELVTTCNHLTPHPRRQTHPDLPGPALIELASRRHRLLGEPQPLEAGLFLPVASSQPSRFARLKQLFPPQRAWLVVWLLKKCYTQSTGHACGTSHPTTRIRGASRRTNGVDSKKAGSRWTLTVTS